MASRRPHIYALGHSTRSFEEFVELLQAHGVRTLADVRKLPGSRRFPHFDQQHLARALPRLGIGYAHLPLLGGRRRSPLGEASPNGAWRNASFRAYADYLETPDFRRGLAELLALPDPVAVMCAEALPWRCHRTLIADALWARGIEVQHIESATRTRPHRLTPFAHVEGTHVTYPAEHGSEAQGRLF